MWLLHDKEWSPPLQKNPAKCNHEIIQYTAMFPFTLTSVSYCDLAENSFYIHIRYLKITCGQTQLLCIMQQSVIEFKYSEFPLRKTAVS